MVPRTSLVHVRLPMRDLLSDPHLNPRQQLLAKRLIHGGGLFCGSTPRAYSCETGVSPAIFVLTPRKP